MKTPKAVVAATLALFLPLASTPAAAWGGGGWHGGGGGSHGGGGWHGGGYGWHGGYYGYGCCSLGFAFGWPYYWPSYAYYPYPAYPAYGYGGDYPPPGAAPPGYSSQSWYYCDDPKGFYPYVHSCARGWQAVPPVPPDMHGPSGPDMHGSTGPEMHGAPPDMQGSLNKPDGPPAPLTPPPSSPDTHDEGM